MKNYTRQAIEQRFDGRRCQIELHHVKIEDENGEHDSKFEVCKVSDAVAILPVVADEEGDWDVPKVLLLENYRFPVNDRFLELVAGLIEPGEDPDEAAKRECEEETGYRPEGVKKLGVFYSSPGLLTEKIHLYLAFGLDEKSQRLETMEDLRVMRYSMKNLIEMLRLGEIKDLKTATGIAMLQAHFS